MERLLKLSEVCEILGICEFSLRKLVSDGEICAINVNAKPYGKKSNLRFETSEVRDFIEKRKTLRVAPKPTRRTRNSKYTEDEMRDAIRFGLATEKDFKTL